MFPMFIAMVIGYLTAKIFAGQKENTKPLIGNVFFLNLRKIKIHVHHWLFGLFIVIIYVFAKLLFFNMEFSMVDLTIIGFFIGVIIQGIVCYKDWREVVIKNE